jgi:HK97 family phage major capsid protein
MEKRLKEILARKTEIRSLLEAGGEVDLDKIQAELASLEDEERQIQQRMEIAGKINTGEIRGNVITPLAPEKREATGTDSLEYRKAFMAYVTKGTEIPTELRADAITATTDVAAVIPETVLNKIVEKMESTGMILPLVTQTAYKGGLTIPTSTVKPVATWVAEGATSDKQKKTTGSITFAYHKLRCAIAVTLETDIMALSAFEATFINNVTEAMVKAIEQAIISGSGTGQPTGILTETPVTGQAIEATPTYAAMVDAEAALPLAYENDAVWCMTKKTFMQFIGMVDSQKQPIARVNNGINGKPERYLLGRQVILCDYMDTYSTSLTAGEVWAFLFNFKDYVLNTNYNMTVKKYEDNDTDDQVTKAIMVADGKVVDKNSLVTLTKAAA